MFKVRSHRTLLIGGRGDLGIDAISHSHGFEALGLGYGVETLSSKVRAEGMGTS